MGRLSVSNTFQFLLAEQFDHSDYSNIKNYLFGQDMS